MMEHKLCRLTTGEFVIASVREEPGFYILKNPIVLAQTREGIGMYPLLAYAKDDTVEIDCEHVLFVAEPADDILAEYVKATSGIVLAPAVTLQ